MFFAAARSGGGGAIPTHEQRRAAVEKDLARVLQDNRSKEYTDFRDRSAYVFITGAFPSHLRDYFNALLSGGARRVREHTSLDGQGGSMKVDPDVVEALKLPDHPMVKKVREFVGNGYRIVLTRPHTTRKPYSRVFVAQVKDGLYVNKKTINLDGSVKEGW